MNEAKKKGNATSKMRSDRYFHAEYIAIISRRKWGSVNPPFFLQTQPHCPTVPTAATDLCRAELISRLVVWCRAMVLPHMYRGNEDKPLAHTSGGKRNEGKKGRRKEGTCKKAVHP